MAKFWSVLLKIGTWGLGHAPAIAQIVIDAKSKNIKGVVEDGVSIAASTGRAQ